MHELTERARTGGLKLTGEGALLGNLTKMVVEGALEGELDDHHGCEKNDPTGHNGGNSRNGYRVETVLANAGPEVNPRYRPYRHSDFLTTLSEQIPLKPQFTALRLRTATATSG
jgi:hypothetical protein